MKIKGKWGNGKKRRRRRGSDFGGILLIGINQVGAEGGVDFLSLKNFFQFIRWLDGPPAYPPSLLGSSLVVEGGFHFGVNLPSRGQQVLHNHKVTILGGKPQGSALVIHWLVGINSWISQQQ